MLRQLLSGALTFVVSTALLASSSEKPVCRDSAKALSGTQSDSRTTLEHSNGLQITNWENRRLRHFAREGNLKNQANKDPHLTQETVQKILSVVSAKLHKSSRNLFEKRLDLIYNLQNVYTQSRLLLDLLTISPISAESRAQIWRLASVDWINPHWASKERDYQNDGTWVFVGASHGVEFRSNGEVWTFRLRPPLTLGFAQEDLKKRDPALIVAWPQSVQ